MPKKKRDALSAIAREAGIGSCSTLPSAWHASLMKILKLCEAEGYDILGDKPKS